MRILHTSDLHWDMEIFREEQHRAKELRDKIDEYEPEVIVISGDIFESTSDDKFKSPYRLLSEYIDDSLPIICVLGNHEFYNFRVDDIISRYRETYEPEKYNVHYLDVIGNYTFEPFTFFGNVLWYDGSTGTVKNQDIFKWAGGRWSDRFIEDFNPIKENKRCIEQIKRNNPHDLDTSVLVTHCIPHIDLNAHINMCGSEFDIFSGIADLFSETGIYPDYSLCGHTHKRALKRIKGVNCINVGNDYREIRTEIIDV